MGLREWRLAALAVAVAILLIDHRLDFFAPFIADVADRDEFRLAEAEQFTEDVRTARAYADAAKDNLVARRNGPGSLAEHHTGDDQWRDGALQNLASGLSTELRTLRF